MAVTERNGEKIFNGVPTDIWPNALLGKNEQVPETARTALDAVASTGAHVLAFERGMDLKRQPHLAPDVCKAAVPVLERAGATTMRILEQLNHQRNTALAAVDERLKEKSPLLGPEIRQHIRSAKSPFSEALAAINEGDEVTAQAIFAAPARVSGLTSEQVAQLRLTASLTFAGEPHALAEEAEKAILRVERARDWLVDFTRTKKLAWNHSSEAARTLADLIAKDNGDKEGRPQA